MANLSNRCLFVCVVVGVWSGIETFAQGQYYPGYPGTPVLRGQGAALQGQAMVVDAYGGLMKQTEQARVIREQAAQAKIDTKRKAFDEMAYERDNTPSFTDEMIKNQSLLVRRVMNKATESEITSGKALNVLMPYIKTLSVQGIQGPPVRLSSDSVQHINISVGSQGGNLGLIREGTLQWPPVLQGATQKKIDNLLPSVISKQVMGQLDFATLKELKKLVQAINEENRKKFHKDEIDSGEFLVGKRYIDSLDATVQSLQNPGSAKVLTGAVRPKGSTVPELVNSMTSQGLQFAPVIPGNESDYFSLYNAMVSYAQGSQSSSGFQAKVGN